MLLKDLVNHLVIYKSKGSLNHLIKGISYHSKQIKQDYIFVCLPGNKRDGHEFINDAISRGAAAVVVDRDISFEGVTVIKVPDTRIALGVISNVFYGYPSSLMKMVGVTGTNGKTTTTHLIEMIISAQGYLTGLIGTINYRIGPQKLPALATTPEASDLQKVLFDMVNSEVKYCVMEVSSHALELHRVNDSDFDIAVLTNITEDHLDFHQTFSRYLAAKGKLFSQLGGGPSKNNCDKVAIINRDDPNYDYIALQNTGQRVTYGVNNDADVMAKEIELMEKGVSFKLSSFRGEEFIKLNLNGMFSVYNALAAISVALVEGIGLESIKKSLEQVFVIPGRFERIDLGQNFTVLVDYAHTPDGLLNVLNTVKEFAQRRIITVFGCGGDRDRTKRPLMGEVAGKISDYCLITSDNPRGEDPDKIVGDILPGIKKTKSADCYEVVLDRYKAIEKAILCANQGDVIIIAGKGHEDYQVFRNHTISFDDREVTRKIIRGRLARNEVDSG